MLRHYLLRGRVSSTRDDGRVMRAALEQGMRESRTSGFVRAQAERLSYSTATTIGSQGPYRTFSDSDLIPATLSRRNLGQVDLGSADSRFRRKPVNSVSVPEVS
jgi:hypothetical protein